MPQNPKNKDLEKLSKLLVATYEMGYISRARLYRLSLIKGILIGFGGALGATLGVALLVWFLSIFDQLPLIGPLLENIRMAVEQR